MDNPATLLTAIMFVTILGMGIGNLLMACAEISGGLRRPAPERIHLSWIILLLLALLSLFWETILLLDIEEWNFLDFLFTLAGPMLLFFGSSVIAAPANGTPSEEDHHHYFSLCGRFFLMLALHEIWLIGIDLRYGGMTQINVINIILACLFFFLIVSRNFRVHMAGAVIAWICFIVPIVMQGIDVIAP